MIDYFSNLSSYEEFEMKCHLLGKEADDEEILSNFKFIDNEKTARYFIDCNGEVVVLGNENYESIADKAFFYCSDLTSINIPLSVKSIGGWVFYRCKKLTSLSIASSVTSIGNQAFYGCSGLTSVEIPYSVTLIGYYVFSSCSNLMSINVDVKNPNYKSENGLMLTKDGTVLIKGVNGDVVIPEGVTNISELSFYNCNELNSVTIPSSVMSIGDSAFSGCDKLKSVLISKHTKYEKNSFPKNCSIIYRDN